MVSRKVSAAKKYRTSKSCTMHINSNNNKTCLSHFLSETKLHSFHESSKFTYIHLLFIFRLTAAVSTGLYEFVDYIYAEGTGMLFNILLKYQCHVCYKLVPAIFGEFFSASSKKYSLDVNSTEFIVSTAHQLTDLIHRFRENAFLFLAENSYITDFFLSSMSILLPRCTWKGQVCDLNKNFRTVMTDIGRCYTFNDNKDKNTLIATEPGKFQQTAVPHTCTVLKSFLIKY